MLDISSIVYSRVVTDSRMKKYLKSSGTTKNDTPSGFPYLYFKTLGEPTVSSSLQNVQCGILASFEITVYDTASSETAKKLLLLTSDIMQSMGFTMYYGITEIDRGNTTEPYRWIARFRRTYCEGDSI